MFAGDFVAGISSVVVAAVAAVCKVVGEVLAASAAVIDTRPALMGLLLFCAVRLMPPEAACTTRSFI